MTLKNNLCVIAVLLFIAGCSESAKNTQPVSAPEGQTLKESPASVPEVTTVIFKNDITKDSAVGGFGYRIFVVNKNDTTFRMHQPTIPAIQGNRGFGTSSDAEKVATLAVKKINAGNSFPTISTGELDSLGIK